MRVQYSTFSAQHLEIDSLPRLPITLTSRERTIETIGIVDSGATINVLPHTVGRELGFEWQEDQAAIRLTGGLSDERCQPIVVSAQVGTFPLVRLAFAWAASDRVALILGQTNFFAEFDVCFYRSAFAFEINAKQSDK